MVTDDDCRSQGGVFSSIQFDDGLSDIAHGLLGGGRQKIEDSIDFAVGLSGIKKVGERVEKGEPLPRPMRRAVRPCVVAVADLPPL